eukprot:5508232-Prymnesium_polylepis.2
MAGSNRHDRWPWSTEDPWSRCRRTGRSARWCRRGRASSPSSTCSSPGEDRGWAEAGERGPISRRGQGA